MNESRHKNGFGKDEEQLIQHTWRLHTNSTSGSVYFEDSVTTIKLYKLILDGFDQM